MTHATLTGSGSGSWWERFGHIDGWIQDMMSFAGGAATTNVLIAGQVPTRYAQIQVDYAAGTADYPDVDNMVTAAIAYESTITSFAASTLASLAVNTLVTMCNKDTAGSAPSVVAAVNFLQTVMIKDAATINYGTLPAVGAQTAGIGAAPVGNPTFFWSTVDGAGRNLIYVFPETIVVTMQAGQDAQLTGQATLGQEPYTVIGQAAQTNFFSFDWLTSKWGSGATISGTLTDPSVSNTGSAAGNLTVNGTFTTFTTTNQADNWTYAVGVATTNFLNGTGTTYYPGQGSLEMLSAGGVKNSVTQAFNTASSVSAGLGGTPYALVPGAFNNTQYAVFLAIKLLSSSPAAGTLTVDLIDGSGSTIADDATTSNTFSIDLTAIADTNWHTYTGVFRLPQALPASTPYKLRLAFTGTILTAANAVFVGAVGVQVMQPFYPGGCYVAGFRGSTAVNASGLYPDYWSFAVTSTPGKLGKAFWRIFNPPSLTAQTPGIIIPNASSGSATVADSLDA